MKNIIKNIGFIVGIFSLVFVACQDNIDPLVEEIQFDRVFTPLNLTAKIRNKTTVELSWDTRSDADSYVVEISEDSLAFTSIVETIDVNPDEIPITVSLDGETLYSARVKGVSTSGIDDSNWATVVFETDAENIFESIADGDVKATSATLRWTAGSEVTHFLIVPGDIQRTITDDEIAAGEATITGLTGETEYTVTLYKNTKQRGSVTFTTLIDIGDATAVYPEDDLSTVIAAAQDGDALVLFPGDFLVYAGTITIDKSISIKGLYPYDRPIIHIQFVLENGVSSIEVKDLEMDGIYTDPETSAEAILDHAFQYNTTGTAYGSLDVSGCSIHDYNKSLLTGASGIVSTIESINMDDCVVTNILTNSADCIDFRGGYLGSLTLQNSTFVNCAPARDFVRLDNTSGTYPGLTSSVLIDHCTLYGVSNNASRRILYVRFDSNTLTVTNTIIAETVGYYTNQSLSTQPVCSKNNYYNATGFYTDGYVSGAKIDVSGNYTTLDPGFADAANSDFTISNQDLKDNEIGDPRWR